MYMYVYIFKGNMKSWSFSEKTVTISFLNFLNFKPRVLLSIPIITVASQLIFYIDVQNLVFMVMIYGI